MLYEDIIYRLHACSMRAYHESKCRYPQWGYQNLEWYITTGRASGEFLNAIWKLSDRRLITLIRKSSCGSCDEAIRIAKRYLKIGTAETSR